MNAEKNPQPVSDEKSQKKGILSILSKRSVMIAISVVSVMALFAAFLGLSGGPGVGDGTVASTEPSAALPVVAAAEERAGIDASPVSAPASDLPEGVLPRFETMLEQNPDTVGFLLIGGTSMSGPVVQAQNNDRYLKYTYNNEVIIHGARFVDFRNEISPDGFDKNTVIYGHRMNVDNMFGEFREYKKLDYYKEHPIIEFSTVYREAKWKIISIFVTNTLTSHGPIFEYRKMDFEDGADFLEFVEKDRIRSLIVTPVDVNEDDRLLTFSTCSRDYSEARLVIVARLVREGEDPSVDVDAAYVNTTPLYPNVWYNKYPGLKKPDTSHLSSVY